MNTKICKNPWCRGTFVYQENDMIEIFNEDGTFELFPPKTCPKCKSFNDELSDGVTWTDRTYEGDRSYFEPQSFKYRITKYR